MSTNSVLFSSARTVSRSAADSSRGYVRVDTGLMPLGEAETRIRTIEWAVVESATRDVPMADLRRYLADRGQTVLSEARPNR
ncbi:hypothetical protein AB0M46_37515 [Dactylosporangium sp. NPDC051485]|uniref:hypothetical protein n=1 Tax=Dactylosporangium sp. NPDC051485 TaxID=3154846 RepID=UPI00342C3AFE